MGDLHLDLLNGSGKTSIIFKNAVHTPDMAFTLISISHLDKAGFSITFNKGMCMVKDSWNKTIATIPCSDGLYKITTQNNKNTIEMVMRFHYLWPQKSQNRTIPVNLEAI